MTREANRICSSRSNRTNTISITHVVICSFICYTFPCTHNYICIMYRIAGMFRRVKVSFFEGGNDFRQFYFVIIIEEGLFCQSEPGNIEDPYAVAILNDSIVVGHVPRKTNTMC